MLKFSPGAVRDELARQERSQRWLGRKSGLHEQTIFKLLGAPPTDKILLSTVNAIARTLAVPASQIVEEEPSHDA